MFYYYKVLWFYGDFTSKNLYFLNLFSVHAARIPMDLSLAVMLSPPKWGTKNLYNSKDFSFTPNRYINFLETKLINIFKMCYNQFHILRLFDVLPNFLSPQVKRCAIITYKHGIYELLHELLNDLRLRILEN